MKKIITLLMIAVLCMSVFAACDEKNTATGDEATKDAATKDEIVLNDKVIEVETPYVSLSVPESFKGSVYNKVSKEDPYTVAFYAQDDDTLLFEIIFNGKGKTLLGTIEGKDKNTVVYMNVPTLDEKSEKYEEHLAYQQGVNTILNHLTANDSFRFNEELPDEDKSETYDIKTSLVTLKYPKIWKDKVTVTEKDGVVTFSDGDTVVFELCYKTCDGNLLGTYDGTPIYIIDHKVETEEQQAMQFDVNVIIEHLTQDEKFTIA